MKVVPPAVQAQMVALRRALHQDPELSWEEERSAARISAALTALGIEHRTGVAGHGLVADLPGVAEGPRVALRADMDALPVQEETGLSYTSQTPGVMHACGHDGHTAMLLGAAALLSAGPPPPQPVRLIWQPAEEKGAGAPAMIEAGVLEGVGAIFAGHVDRRYPAGVLVVTDGPVNASTDTFHIEIHGQQGHGARPHEAVDAVVVGSLLVTALQTIVSREVDPAHPSVVSIGSFHAGTASNVIAGHALLEGTIRAQSPENREQLRVSIRRIADAIGQLHGAQVSTEVRIGIPPVINRPEPTAMARAAAVRVAGAEGVVPLHTANMGGEDFSYYLEHVPGCYVRYGAQVPGREGFPAHSSRFDINEDALATGAAWLAEVAREAGQQLGSGRA